MEAVSKGCEQGGIVELNDPKPKDNKTFWMASHCGPGTIDDSEICGFCGKTMGECARINTEAIKETGDQDCGGSGFWCSACGRFWAEDSCGESNDEPYSSIDEKCSRVDNTLYCCCGGKLFNMPMALDK